VTSAPAEAAEPDLERRLGFLVAGVQKGGTTSLYKMLAQHPQIARAAAKELHFFDRDRLDWANPDYASYHRRIRWHEDAIVAGEATPIYLFWPGAMERIQVYNPQMRLVLSFRDPIERAFSQWCMEKERRSATPDFGEAIRIVSPTRWPRTAAEAGRPHQAFVGRGYYGDQLAHVLELFPADQVLALDYHRLFAELQTSLDQITDLIGVSRFSEPPPLLHQRAQPEQLDASPPREEDVARLVDLYADDLASFSTLSGLDVSAWPTAQVANGSLPPSELAARLAAKVTFVEDTPADAARQRQRRDKAKERRKRRRATQTDERSAG
jgi:hypothetical protein